MTKTVLQLRLLRGGVRCQQGPRVDERLLQHSGHLDAARGAVGLEVCDAHIDGAVLDVVRQTVAVGHDGAERGEAAVRSVMAMGSDRQ